MMMMIMMMMMMIHNDLKQRYDGGMVCHKTKNATEKTQTMMMVMKRINIEMTKMEIRLFVKMDDWRSYLDQNVDKLLILS